MIETAVVVVRMTVVHYHVPPGATSGFIPDPRGPERPGGDYKSLWDILWAHRDTIASPYSGMAHTHPGEGVPSPSMEDLTTFAACEAGLGVLPNWWIASSTDFVCVRRRSLRKLDYVVEQVPEPYWVDLLRQASENHG